MRRAEETAFALQPVFADPLALLSLAIESESNALARVADPARLRTPVEEQQASSWLFQTFSDKIGPFLDQLDAEAEKKAAEAPDAAPSGAEAPAAAAGAPDAEGQGAEALSAKTREEIRRLCSETSGTYSLVAMGLSPALQVLPDDQLPNARQIAANLDELRKLLSPPPQQQQQQQQNQQQQNQQQDQQQDQQSSQDRQQGEDQERDPQSGEKRDEKQDDGREEEPSGAEESPQNAESGEEKPSEEDEKEARGAEESEEAPDPDDEKAAALMQRMLDQEKRRAEERRARRHALPPKVGERDW